MTTRPSSLSVKDEIRPAQPTRLRGKLFPAGDFDLARLGRRLHHADQAIAGQGVIDQSEIARLEYVERERGARQQNGAAQRKQRQHLRHVGDVAIAVGHPQEMRSLASREQQR